MLLQRLEADSIGVGPSILNPQTDLDGRRHEYESRQKRRCSQTWLSANLLTMTTPLTLKSGDWVMHRGIIALSGFVLISLEPLPILSPGTGGFRVQMDGFRVPRDIHPVQNLYAILA